MTTVATAETDAALGTLAATAEQTGCPPEPVRRMCELGDFTRGLDTTAITAVAGAGTAVMDAAARIAPLVTEAAGVIEGIGGGVPSQGLCDTREALVSHSGLWQDAVSSVGSCAGAMDQLTAGCAGEISALVEDVSGLASTALACGAGDAAAGMVQGAVAVVSDMLGQRNSGLAALVDITVGDCLPAVDGMLVAGAAGAAGLALGAGAAVAVGGAMEMVADLPVEPDCPEPEPEAEPSPAPESSVDPVHGFDKNDRLPGATGAPTVVAEVGTAPASEDATPPVSPAAVGEAPEAGSAGDTGDAATDGWNPDIWTTDAGVSTGTAPESAEAW